MLNIGIIGMGDVYLVHRPCVEALENAKLVALCDIDETKKELANGVNFYTDLEDMLKNEKIDILHVCLPHYLHVPITKIAASYNVNIFLEKPVALNYEEGKELLDIKNVKIGICLQNRYNATTQKLKNILTTNEYGKLLGLKGIVSWFRPHGYYEVKPWRGSLDLAGGGVMNNQTIHTIDLLQYFAGSATSIKGHVDNILHKDLEVEDTALANIEFSNNVRALYFATNAYCGNSSVEIQVLTEKAKLTIKDFKLTISENDTDKKLIIEDEIFSGTKSYYGAGHLNAIKHFYSAIENDTLDFISVAEGLESVKIIDAIRKSSELNETLKLA